MVSLLEYFTRYQQCSERVLVKKRWSFFRVMVYFSSSQNFKHGQYSPSHNLAHSQYKNRKHTFQHSWA